MTASALLGGTDDNGLLYDQCEKDGCKMVDTAPKFHVLIPGDKGPVVQTMHTDCASQHGYGKASLILSLTGNAKNDELRTQLGDLSHPVHEEVVQHNLREYASNMINVAAQLRQPKPTIDQIVEHMGDVNPNPTQSFIDHVSNQLNDTVMSAIKQARGTNFLNAEYGATTFTARTGAIVLELDTAVGSQAANGTPVAGNGYASQACPFSAATTQTGANSALIANSGTPTFTAMPAVTITAIELLDSAATALHLAYGLLTTSKTTNLNDTVSASVGAISVAM